jgi:hypothetical protein
MFSLGALSFAAPVALLALAAVPVLWWLLRVIPPAPKRVRFPAIRIIMRLVNPEESSAKTPLWLTLLRIALILLVIVGAAHPILNAQNNVIANGPLVLVVDDDWAAARNWQARQRSMGQLLDRAQRDGRPVAVVTTSPGEARSRNADSLMTAEAAREIVQAMEPKPWPADRLAAAALIDALAANPQIANTAQVMWLSNGLDAGSADEFSKHLAALGSVTVLNEEAGNLPALMMPPTSERTGLTLHARRPTTGTGDELRVQVRDDRGGVLARRTMTFESGKTTADLTLELPVELRNRIASIEAEDQKTAGGMVLVDERWRRRPVGIIAGVDRKSDQPLLDDIYYLERALDPFTEVRTGALGDLLKREIALLIVPDTGRLGDTDRNQIESWLSKGGFVLRFAGPRLAQSADTLLPVRLRQGDRDLGGALSWAKPASLAPFDETSPFHGLAIADDIRIRRQVLAQPTVDLGEKTWARLADGTPLVTAEKRGDGWLVFVHTTASPDWSNLPLSGLFVGMLRNMVQLSRGVAGSADDRLLTPLQTVDGFGRLGSVRAGARALRGNAFEETPVGPDHPPGFYGDESARRAFNLAPKIESLEPIAALQGEIVRGSYEEATERDMRGGLLMAALILALVDIIASFVLRGFFNFNRNAAAAGFALLLIGVAGQNAYAQMQVAPRDLPRSLDEDTRPFAASLTVRLAYYKTGDAQLDARSRAGLSGLSFIANTRTAAELGEPIGVDPAHDDLSFFPLIYWPLSDIGPPLDEQTADRVNHYMKSGGTILFDTRDGDGASQAAARLQDMGRFLDLPPLVTIPSDHILTKSYYLLRDLPGRFTGGRVWVERDGARTNDGVSSIIVGPNDWASAWAMDESRKPMYPTVPGGEKQRELAYRFGINLVMYALTGNYKGDQVHLPSILERLGQ